MPTESMYHRFFGLQEAPFALTPDPRFLFMSDHHREALAHLLYGMGEWGGFVQLTGEIGTGKTTLCRSLLAQVPEQVDIALVFNPKLTAAELVASVCDELNIAYPAETTSLKILVDRLNRYLLDSHAAGRRTVLVIDEAQNLSAEVLEQIRLLTNLETAARKLLQIILIGQPELQNLMKRSSLRQLKQRITARYHLTPLGPEDSARYIRHRLTVAGGDARLFTPRAVRAVYRHSGGIPRLINIICDRAMLGAYAEKRPRITARIVATATREVLGGRAIFLSANASPWLWGALATAGLAAVFSLYLSGWPEGVRKISGPTPVRISDRHPPPGAGAGGPTSRQPRPAAAAAPPEASNASSAPTAAEFAEQLASANLPTDTRSAFEALFDIWNIRSVWQPDRSACQQARSVGLECLFRQGNWTTLKRYNRPAVLELRDSNRQIHHLAVTTLDETKVTLKAAEVLLQLPKSTVEPLWYGDFILLWRPPAQKTLLKKGDNGDAILWLRDRLHGIAGGAEELQNSHFDSALESTVLKFQRSLGLTPDGLVGAETIIRLNTLANAAPTLGGPTP